MAKAEYVTDDTFEQEVLNSERPVLVDFTATWCGPCQDLGPILDEIADEREATLKIVKVDVSDDETNPQTKEDFGVRVFPTLVVIRDGKVAEIDFGGGDKSEMNTWINDALAKDKGDDMVLDEGKAYAEQKLEALMTRMRQAQEAAEKEQNTDNSGGTPPKNEI